MNTNIRSKLKRVFAESYSGSGDIDQRNVADGSETLNSVTQDPRMNGGVYMDNEYQIATMPSPLDVHNQDERDMHEKPDPSRSDEYSSQEFGEQMVDDNHANNVATASINPPESLNSSSVGGAGDDFLRSAPDSPEILHDGHPIEELENNQQGINYVVNTDAPHADGPGANMILNDPTIVDKVHSLFQQVPDINKGRTAFVTSLFPAKSAGENAWVAPSGSNVADIVDADEVRIKHDRSTHDFGMKDESGDETTMAANPGRGYTGDEYESTLYSGIQPSAADKVLQNYLAKIAELQQKAIGYVGVNPSSNSNSGRDDDALDPDVPIPPAPLAMTDGKMSMDSIEEKVDNDPTVDRQKRQPKYNKTTDDGAEYYFNYLNTGGGFGGEGSGDFSGVASSN